MPASTLILSDFHRCSTGTWFCLPSQNEDDNMQAMEYRVKCQFSRRKQSPYQGVSCSSRRISITLRHSIENRSIKLQKAQQGSCTSRVSFRGSPVYMALGPARGIQSLTFAVFTPSFWTKLHDKKHKVAVRHFCSTIGHTIRK